MSASNVSPKEVGIRLEEEKGGGVGEAADVSLPRKGRACGGFEAESEVKYWYLYDFGIGPIALVRVLTNERMHAFHVHAAHSICNF